MGSGGNCKGPAKNAAWETRRREQGLGLEGDGADDLNGRGLGPGGDREGDADVLIAVTEAGSDVLPWGELHGKIREAAELAVFEDRDLRVTIGRETDGDRGAELLQCQCKFVGGDGELWDGAGIETASRLDQKLGVSAGLRRQ